MNITTPQILKIIKRAGVAAVSLCVIGGSIYNVQPGYRALIFDRRSGLEDKIYPEGTHLKLPFIQSKIICDIRARPYERKTTSGSRDLQMVDIEVRVLNRLMVDHLHTIYRELGPDCTYRVLPSIVDDTVQAVVAQYDASQLLSQREKVSSEIREMLKKRADYFHIVLDDVSITSIALRKEYTAANEAKQSFARSREREANCYSSSTGKGPELSLRIGV